MTFVAHAHQRLELEGNEIVIEHDVGISIEKPAERPGQRERAQAVAHGRVLHLADQVGDGALFNRRLGHQIQRTIKRLGLQAAEA